jgi:hypothetical protein
MIFPLNLFLISIFILFSPQLNLKPFRGGRIARPFIASFDAPRRSASAGEMTFVSTISSGVIPTEKAISL